MIWKLSHFVLTSIFLCIAVGICGCAEHDPAYYKNEADEQVYSIIDQKWQTDFGSRVNYKISDTPPSPNDVEIGKAVPPSGILGLRQAVSLATVYNREYQAQKEALYVMALDLRLVRHEFEPQLFGGASGGYTADRNDEVLAIETNLGFNQLLAGGARISARLAVAWADVLTGNLRSGLASILGATVIQPLLRGSGREIVLENLTQAERDTLYQLRLFNRFRKTFVVSTIGQYYRVLQELDAVQNAQRNYDTLTWVYERAEKLANAGRLPRFELDQARQDKLRAWDEYVQATKQYKQVLDEFKIQLTLPPEVELQLDLNELEVLRQAGMSEPDFSETDVIDTALVQRLDLANSADAIIDAERKVFVAADGLRADLNIVGMAAAISARRADRSTLRWLREDYNLGLELNLPLDRVLEQNLYRKALIALTQRQREYEQAMDVVTLQVRQDYRDLVEAAERHKTQSESLGLAKRRFKNTFLLLQYRRANTRDVLDAQRDMFGAQDAATAALVDYTIATLYFYRDTGVLQVRPDGMWQR